MGPVGCIPLMVYTIMYPYHMGCVTMYPLGHPPDVPNIMYMVIMLYTIKPQPRNSRKHTRARVSSW